MKLVVFVNDDTFKPMELVCEDDIEAVFKAVERVYPIGLYSLEVSIIPMFLNVNDPKEKSFYVQIITDDGEVARIGYAESTFPLGRNKFVKGKKRG